MKPSKRYRFQGDPKNRPQKPHPHSPARPEPYIAYPELIQAVNLAIYLRRPLLLEGEAGCGKTRLAAAVAYELGLPFYRWDIRSTSKAREGLYEYDAMLRLHDVQAKTVDKNLPRDPSNSASYCRLGALGKAFQLQDTPAVVLIDEIDKADLDFPNDLLSVLDEPWQFEIPETNQTIAASAGNQPIVIITSNKEKGNLPTPFLRRCLYSFVSFPNSPDRLREIVEAHYRVQGGAEGEEPQDAAPATELIQAAAKRFLAIRNMGKLFKNPGTSEFLDWLAALQNFGADPYPVSALEQGSGSIPYREVLFKLRADWQNAASPQPGT